jgi:hypothetical protein
MRDGFVMQKNTCGDNDIGCTMHAVSLTPHAKYDTACTYNGRSIRAALAALKGHIYKKKYVRELSYPTTTELYKFKGAS